jgi:hypothetical protein
VGVVTTWERRLLGLQASEFKESMPRKLHLWTDDRSSSSFEGDVTTNSTRLLLEVIEKKASENDFGGF